MARREATASRPQIPREKRAKSRASRAAAHPRRECIALSDLTDCLLEAYDSVAHRAHQKFLDRGSVSGGELEDWLNAERELLPGFPVNVEESGECVYALASFPGVADARVSVGIESRWLVILAHPAAPAARGKMARLYSPFAFSNCRATWTLRARSPFYRMASSASACRSFLRVVASQKRRRGAACCGPAHVLGTMLPMLNRE